MRAQAGQVIELITDPIMNIGIPLAVNIIMSMARKTIIDVLVGLMQPMFQEPIMEPALEMLMPTETETRETDEVLMRMLCRCGISDVPAKARVRRCRLHNVTSGTRRRHAAQVAR